MAALVTDLPVIKVPLMGLSGEITLDDLDRLIDRFGSA